MTPLKESKPDLGAVPIDPEASGWAGCDAALSAWDPWLSRLYFETLVQLSRSTRH